jgi:hypothetical protein
MMSHQEHHNYLSHFLPLNAIADRVKAEKIAKARASREAGLKHIASDMSSSLARTRDWLRRTQPLKERAQEITEQSNILLLLKAMTSPSHAMDNIQTQGIQKVHDDAIHMLKCISSSHKQLEANFVAALQRKSQLLSRYLLIAALLYGAVFVVLNVYDEIVQSLLVSKILQEEDAIVPLLYSTIQLRTWWCSQVTSGLWDISAMVFGGVVAFFSFWRWRPEVIGESYRVVTQFGGLIAILLSTLALPLISSSLLALTPLILVVLIVWYWWKRATERTI